MPYSPARRHFFLKLQWQLLAYPPAGCKFHPRCRYAKALCQQQEPELRALHPGHFAACHFVEELRLTGVG